MRIKKLEIFGFKSFANRQSIIFDSGVTAIVGPNGCGKSNVVDALRWVMGEQNARHLRGANMQDIIFCGSDKKAALGFAEVILTIENNEQDAPLEYNHFHEIEITRRLYKSGDSEYEINRQKARLKDISDFFLGTGVGTKAYSIIEQGRINDIVSAKPVDRRLFIEEAAGITKYKAKKALAERRMEATRSNLHRIIDIKNEVDRRVSALVREKEKLLKAQSMKQQIRDIDLHIASHQYLALCAEASFLTKNLGDLKFDITENNREIAVVEQSFSRLLNDYSHKHERKRLLIEIEGQHASSRELLKKDLEYTAMTLNDNRLLVTRISSQLDDIDQRKHELSDDIDRFTTEHELCHRQFTDVTKKLSEKKKDGQSVVEKRQKNLTDERDRQKMIIDAATRAARLQAEINVFREQEVQKQIDIKNVDLDLVHKADELTRLKNQIGALALELEQGISRKNCLQSTLNELATHLGTTREAQIAKDKELGELEKKRMAYSSRLKSLLEINQGLEWSESGIVDLLASDSKHLIKAVLADIIKVKPGNEDVVEKCLAHMLDAAVLLNSDDLTFVADLLKKNKSKKTSFFLLNQHNIAKTISKPLGLKSLSDLLIISDQEYEDLSSLYGCFFLADNLAHALSHWSSARMANATIVSLDGEMLLPDGRAIIPGLDNGNGVLKRKNEIVDLENSITEFNVFIKERTAHKEALSKEIIALEAEKEKNLLELRPLNIGIVRLEESIKQKNLELGKAETEITKLKEKQVSLNNNKSNVDDKIASLQKQWSDALDDHKHHEEALSDIRSERSTVEAAYETFHQEIKQIEITKVQCHEKLENLATTLTQTKKNLAHVMVQQQAFLDQINEKSEEELRLKEGERQTEKKIAAITKELVETTKLLSTLRLECETLSLEKTESEKGLAALQAQGRLLSEKLHTIDLKLNTTRNEQNNVCDRIMDRYRLKLLDMMTDFHDRMIDEKAAKKESHDLQRALERMGPVNENAANEFAELSARGQFLEAQVNDLNDALTQLESAIKKINKTTKLRFQEAFDSINKQFSLVFPRLFNGGKAELVLCDEEDTLTSGVDIMAKPPGKHISSIELMSGGEKALTAVSLIMAIFLIKPSPFCLLDEVDAPLDEANVSRFSQLIKEMSTRSQFIVITHNRKTMESADQLYGVTMEDAGMSKIVSVHVQEAFNALKQTRPTELHRPQQLHLEDV